MPCVDDWLGDVPFEPGPPHVRMGTHTVDEPRWLLADRHREAELGLKARLLEQRRSEVVAVAGDGHDSVPAQEATLALVGDWLRRHRPDLAGSAASGRTGRSPTPTVDSAAPVLEAAARLVQEDLCLMAVGTGVPVLTAAVVCFPSYWRLREKIGRAMDAIHRPVPDYAHDLSDRPDRLLTHLGEGRILGRRNWSVHDGGDLFAPRPSIGPPLAVDAVPERLWLRSERQTLRRLPAGDHILFTIRVQQMRFDDLGRHPAVARRLAAAVRAEAPHRLDRFADGQVAPLLAWIDGLADPASP